MISRAKKTGILHCSIFQQQQRLAPDMSHSGINTTEHMCLHMDMFHNGSSVQMNDSAPLVCKRDELIAAV